MKDNTKKGLKITALIAAVLLVTIIIVAMVLFIPLNGKKNNYFWSYGDVYKQSDVAEVEKNASEEFDIMVITDLQLWMGNKDNKAALQMVKDMAASQKPDLIVTVGDNVSGILTDGITKDFVKTMEDIGIPWAPIFGNHDQEGKATLNWQGDRFEEAEHSLFSKGPSNLYGVGNYAINITEGGKAIQALYLFDNGRYYNYDKKVDYYGEKVENKEIWMGYEQIAWYEWNVRGLMAAQNSDSPIPSMSFSHFAAPQFRTAIMENCEESADGFYYVPEELGFGACDYLPGVAPVDSGFFDIAKENGTHTMVFGHDHENNAVIDYEGVTLAYGQKTGPSPAPWNNALEYGVTMITIGNADVDYAVSLKHVIHSKANK